MATAREEDNIDVGVRDTTKDTHGKYYTFNVCQIHPFVPSIHASSVERKIFFNDTTKDACGKFYTLNHS